MEVKMLQSAVLTLPMPLGTRTRATARPSGTLWTARVREMKTPSWGPLAPPKETPMPTPSVKECSVMTKMRRRTLRESRPGVGGW